MKTVTHRRASLTIGTVTTGAAGTPASATITDGDVLNLTLPKGDKGDTGDKGDPGDPTENFTYMSASDMEDACDAAFADEEEEAEE